LISEPKEHEEKHDDTPLLKLDDMQESSKKTANFVSDSSNSKATESD
jgi:hypothetical protein